MSERLTDEQLEELAESDLFCAGADELRMLRALIPEVIERLEAFAQAIDLAPIQSGYYRDLDAIIAKLREASQ